MIEDTWNRHRLGIGVFSMQGFERRNKESKRCIQNNSNNKGNIIIQNLMRLLIDFLKCDKKIIT